MFLVLTVVSLYAYRKVLGDTRRFSFITGKAYAPRPISLGRWRIATKAACYLLIFVLCVLPVFVVAWNAFMPYPQVPSFDNLHLLTVKNFGAALDYGPAIRAVINSLLLGLAAGLIATLFGFAVALLQYRSNQQTLASLADHIGTAPITFPGILVGVSSLDIFDLTGSCLRYAVDFVDCLCDLVSSLCGEIK